jgi:hypothetical protein
MIGTLSAVKKLTFTAGFLLLLTGIYGSASAQEETDKGVKKFGTVHNIADDRRIEKIGGLYEPEGLDKYMKRLFDGLQARIAGIETQVARMEKQLQEIHALIKNSSSGGKQDAK